MTARYYYIEIRKTWKQAQAQKIGTAIKNLGQKKLMHTDQKYRVDRAPASEQNKHMPNHPNNSTPLHARVTETRYENHNCHLQKTKKNNK